MYLFIYVCHVCRNQGICKGNSQKMHKTDECMRFLFFTCQRARCNQHQPLGQAFRVIHRLLVVQLRIQAAIRAAQRETVHTCSHHVPVTCSTREVCHVNSSYPQTKTIKSH